MKTFKISWIESKTIYIEAKNEEEAEYKWCEHDYDCSENMFTAEFDCEESSEICVKTHKNS